MHKNIVIVGCGENGSTTASILSEQGNYVYIIDKDPLSFEKLDKGFSGITIEKEISDVMTLKNLIEDKVDILLVVTEDDNLNIFLSIMAKNILSIDTVITRLYDETRNCLLLNEDIDVFYPSLLSLSKIESYLQA